ncbi:[LysW]-aminoadipate semialdehyde/glutamate semialdehyde transaminase [Candidatus Lokiarchaeum ossiferum]|uniref:[LysW]-aminoadipate semialdehyde/glutamate semialdehyde transaminase n=1 Tax=Candidatus Lokiarchaeum ossiferum TaxID=2951803 RepID=A0ABY6HPY9_9ARCH|nr:[LysW]-aminoadipate semialdehyde/glutamate semialdehyde transaminase [Candidatus Lokiarchaeum sp. B-35]
MTAKENNSTLKESDNIPSKDKVMGRLPQKELYKLYSKYVSKPKADFFKSIGLGVIQGKRERLTISMLEGKKPNKPPIQLLDCRTSGGVFNLGHRHPAIIKAMVDGINAGLDIGDHHLISEQRALLAKELADLLPGDISQTQFCVGGGEAIDLAIKLARSTTKRKKVLSAKLGYHGVTGLAVAAGDSKFSAPFLANSPDFVQVEFGNIESLISIINDTFACLILETIPATGGILIAPPSYFTQVRELCDKHGVLLIADEVQSGLGRTGEMWGIYGGIYPEEKIVPDIMVLAKGMSAGYYPLATCSYKPFIGEVFEQDPFIHISTTGGSELGCYVTRKMLEIISKPTFLQNVQKMGTQLGESLQVFKTQYPSLITEVRGRGLMWGMEFINERYGVGYTLQMIKNGIFADYCGNNEQTIKLMPPLITNTEEMKEIIRRLNEALLGLPLPKNT